MLDAPELTASECLAVHTAPPPSPPTPHVCPADWFSAAPRSRLGFINR